MAHKNFNRHDLFDNTLMSFHSATISKVQEWNMNDNRKMIDSTVNMLYGIWDGYLYDELPKAIGHLPTDLQERILITIKLIEQDIQLKGETITQI